ncbi:hypothetical protein ACFC18_02045 [Streptomyces sp. NPDC056121]|uniref:hypothetical protein n=1 Tax=Streptomyces TaxID=1883 RepID=UPI001D0AEE01|nr:MULTISPECIES: hypothetical protein [Streptomyces]MCX5082217.1 hypothetical protein [Streptomyces sp. NBC_00401]UDM00399.1 hypothetical protein LGI35_19995 [Streptomyces longhuiensis]
MHGQGYMPPPQRPSHGVQIGLRVLFVALAVLSIGFLAWTALLRLALTTRSRTDWIVFASVAALQAGTVALLATDPGVDEFTTWRGDAGMTILLITLAGVVSYYLVADIRHGRKGRLGFYGGYASGYQPQQPPLQRPAYGYPQAQHYAPPTPHPAPPSTPPVHDQLTQTAGQAPTPVPNPAPQTQTPPPHRIDQVRAELDELSDYLRKQEGGR